MSGRYDNDRGSRYQPRRDDRGGGGGGGGGRQQEMRAGDWNCDDCGFHNYASRSECFKCHKGKGGGGGGGGRRRSRSRSRSPPRRGANYQSRGSPPRGYGGAYKNDRGDNWDCDGCGFSNFAKRFECLKCKEPRKDGGGDGGGGFDKRSRGDDWSCKDCNFSNFASRTSCYKCQTPK